MSETQEGNSSQSFSGEGPQTSMQEESRYQLMPEIPASSDLDDFVEPAGETSDVVADDKQETNEDSTADEEEPTTWQSSQSPEERTERHIEDADLTSIVQPKSTYHDSTADSSDVFETAGEAADVVQDATQTGNDQRAANAEDRSLDQDPTQNHMLT